MPNLEFRVDETNVRFVYGVTDRNSTIGVSGFQAVAFGYTLSQPDAVWQAVRLYMNEGGIRETDKPDISTDEVGFLFKLALRQPRDWPVSKAVAMAIAMAAVPENELGLMSSNARY